MRTRILAVALALASLTLIACNDDDDTPDPTMPGDTSSTPAPGVTETPVSGVTQLSVGEPVELPEHLALIIETGCWQCDGTTESLVRIRRTSDGIEARTLFRAADFAGNVTGYAFNLPTGHAAVSTCGPNCTGLGEITGTEQTVVHTSTDGGVTFAPSMPIEGWFSVEGYSSGSLVVSGSNGSAAGCICTFPEMTHVPRPADGGNPHPLPSEVLWTRIDPVTHERTALLAPDGTVLFASAGDNISNVTHLDEAGDRVAVLVSRLEGGDVSSRLFIGNGAKLTLDHERTLQGFIFAGGALDDCTIVGNTDIPRYAVPTPDPGRVPFVGFLPAIIDVCDGVTHPILDPFTREPYLNGRNFVVAVQVGPFLAVADDVGDCLNVRESPSTAATSLGCFSAGVLLRDLEDSHQGEGQTWRRVTSPAGIAGWASDEFLTP